MPTTMKIPTIPRQKSRTTASLVTAARALAALLSVILAAGAASGQQCLHGPDESASERERREAAIAFAELVIDAQRKAQQDEGTFVALNDAVSLRTVPLGFVPRLTFDRWSYALSLKDLFDPCGFALFADQDGRIYEARPVAPSNGRAPASAPAAGGDLLVRVAPRGSGPPPETVLSEPGRTRAGDRGNT